MGVDSSPNVAQDAANPTNGFARNLALVCLGLIVRAIAVRAPLVFYGPVLAHDVDYTFTAARRDTLAIGALCALALRDPRWFERLRAWTPRAALAFGVAVLVQIGSITALSR